MKKTSLFILGFLFMVSLVFADTIWSEDFSTYAAGTGIDGSGNIGDYPASVTKWTLDVSNCNFYGSTSDWIKTVSGVMEGKDLDGTQQAVD